MNAQTRIKRRQIAFTGILFLLVILTVTLYGRHTKDQEELLRSNRTEEDIKIDGNLSEAIWQRSADVDTFFTEFIPNPGEASPFRTKVWLAHDDRHLYFAFYCYDNEPEKIVSAITSRDNIWNHDWVGLNIDLTGTKRYGYVLVSNPHGIQWDLFDSPEHGGNEATDFVWKNAAKVTDSGYIVEIEINLKNFNYKRGEPVVVNILFERKIARFSTVSTHPAVPAGQPFFTGMTPLVYDRLKYTFSAEVLPTLTYGSNWERKDPDTWDRYYNKFDFGVSGRARITSNITLDATYNPDFSQVESDEMVVRVNQRYPIYYSEKRPFFMEAGSIFNLASGALEGQSFMKQVHTRKIIDPQWGFQVTGEVGKIAFGTMVVDDRWYGRKYRRGQDKDTLNPHEGESVWYEIARMKYGFRGENFTGLFVSNRNFLTGYNRVFGADVNIKPEKTPHLVKGFLLYSLNKDPAKADFKQDFGGNILYKYQSRRIQTWFEYEYIGKDFIMQAAFIKRTGISNTIGMVWFNHYPKRITWLQKVTLIFYGDHVFDLFTNRSDIQVKAGLVFSAKKQGSFRFVVQHFKEYWNHTFHTGFHFNCYGEAQPVKWLILYGRIKYGDKINYDPTNTFTGTGIGIEGELLLQPGSHFSQIFNYQYDDLHLTHGEGLVYAEHILSSKTVFQFNKYLFIRATLQYDSYFQTLLSDILLSFTLIPGTILQVGYGSAHESLYWDAATWAKDREKNRFYQTDQGFFIKAGYRIIF